MQKQIDQLIQFHKAFGVPVLNTPKLPKLKRANLRFDLIDEEYQELVDSYNEGDLTLVADALCDLLYVTFGTALEFGLQGVLEKCFDEIQRSNMSKLDENGKPIYREDGKILKSNLYSPPDLKSIIK